MVEFLKGGSATNGAILFSFFVIACIDLTKILSGKITILDILNY